MANFTLDMSRFANKSLGEIEQVVRKTAIDLTTSIIKTSPVDSGRFRANWFVSFEDAIDNTTEDTNSAKALSNATNTLLNGKIGKYIYIQNNLDYAVKLEYGASKQAPAGIVRVNVERFAQR